MAWRIEISETAEKQLAKMGRSEARRITAFLYERIAERDDPRSAGKALTGSLGGLWGYRVGDHRIVCRLEDNRLIVLVLQIGHRRDIYR